MSAGRKEFIDKMIANQGGTLESFHFAFGEADVIVIAELPDEATAAAISMAVGAAGVATAKTTVLLDAATVDSATQETTGYRAPGA